MEAKDRIIVALDVDSLDEALEIVEELKDHVGLFKVGLELIFTIFVQLLAAASFAEACANLRKAVDLFALLRGRIMLDPKLKDIPNTMGGASAAIARLGVTLFTVHASAGMSGMAAAVKRAGDAKVLAVTVLTSMSPDDCGTSYGDPSIRMTIRRLARMAKVAGVHGIVCAPTDVADIRSHLSWNPEFVCPGIRPAWAATGDQNKDRAMTPAEAIGAGVTRMVIGRPITRPPPRFPTRRDAAIAIADEIAAALAP